MIKYWTFLICLLFVTLSMIVDDCRQRGLRDGYLQKNPTLNLVEHRWPTSSPFSCFFCFFFRGFPHFYFEWEWIHTEWRTRDVPIVWSWRGSWETVATNGVLIRNRDRATPRESESLPRRSRPFRWPRTLGMSWPARCSTATISRPRPLRACGRTPKMPLVFLLCFSRCIILPMLILLVMVLVMVIVMIMVLPFFSWYRHDVQNVSKWRKSRPLEKMEMFMGCLISRGAVTAGGAWHPLRLARQGPRRLLHWCARPQRRWLPPAIPARERSA